MTALHLRGRVVNSHQPLLVAALLRSVVSPSLSLQSSPQNAFPAPPPSPSSAPLSSSQSSPQIVLPAPLPRQHLLADPLASAPEQGHPAKLRYMPLHTATPNAPCYTPLHPATCHSTQLHPATPCYTLLHSATPRYMPLYTRYTQRGVDVKGGSSRPHQAHSQLEVQQQGVEA